MVSEKKRAETTVERIHHNETVRRREESNGIIDEKRPAPSKRVRLQRPDRLVFVPSVDPSRAAVKHGFERVPVRFGGTQDARLWNSSGHAPSGTYTTTSVVLSVAPERGTEHLP